ncbi:pantetheine-phosphate adenylyltransferase [Marinilactibacillus sp. 15R]|uniref:Phosphopantetheine adenylyltransferase n=1 Tax=Marinilactibacillus piezotolerans TaxID=258723 RepID=A0A1I3Z4Z2_9LACT|nr:MULTISPECIES: pantetheine-phosphate adenylyltransferase [Marinilactibacillus]API89225.1 pantetheine-phosphate adenylyltransferase [Marinilactibacillus sp. 15R]SFK38616.1 Phosphopantetheine adenylyltransferase [Marinilactibacillus piezotolerans]
MKKKAVYAGSFDPFTFGHLNITLRGAELFDEVIITVSDNISKKSLFDVDDKVDMITQVINKTEKSNIKVIKHQGGLTVDLVKELKATAMIRGIRSVKDMEYEMDIAAMNKVQAPEIDTVFLIADEKYRFISSSLIKEVVKFGGNAEGLVPADILNKMKNIYAK